MDTIVITILSGALTSVLAAVVLKKLSAMERKEEIVNTNRKAEMVLILETLDASAELSVIMAKCLKEIAPEGKKPNGTLSRAIEERVELQRRMKKHLLENHDVYKV